MKRFALALAAALALSGCAGLPSFGIPAAPAAVANQTVLDEQGVQAAELAYKAARIAVEIGVDAGLIRGANATRFAAIDNKVFAALGIARTAYRANNAVNYAVALAETRAAVFEMLALTGKGI